MFRTTSTAAMMVLLAWAVPAFGELHTFQIDETKSTVVFDLSFLGQDPVTSEMEGTFELKLGGSSPNWSGAVEMEIVNAWNLDLVNLLGMFIIQPGSLTLTDFDENDDDSGTLSGSPIATGTVATQCYVDAEIDGQDPLQDWIDSVWSVEVADDNAIGSKEPGWTPEARLVTSGFISADIGLANPLNIPFNIELVGAEVPEPSTLTLLLGGMLMVAPLAWRRRRRA